MLMSILIASLAPEIVSSTYLPVDVFSTMKRLLFGSGI
jgi:hypothetical protein